MGLYNCNVFVGVYYSGLLWKIPYSVEHEKKFVGIFCTVSFLTIWKILELKVGRSIGAEHYQNPMVILAAIAVFMIFHNLKLESQVINRMSKGCFTVFLVH